MQEDRRIQIWMAVGFLIVLTVITILAGIFFSGAPAPIGGFQATTVAPITSADWTLGNKSAKVSVIEYGDFQCPACATYEPIVQQLEKDYAANVLFVFRNFPLPQHQHGMIASQAAEAAGLQGKYWEMHDLLYQKQNDWAEASGDVVAQYFDAYAQSLGLDVQKFNTDINSAGVKQKIQNDVASANAGKVDHTPTFFINLTQVQNPQNYAAFKSLIDAALASSTASQ